MSARDHHLLCLRCRTPPGRAREPQTLHRPQRACHKTVCVRVRQACTRRSNKAGPYVASRDARFVVSIVVVHIVCAVCMDLFARPAGNKSPLISALPCMRWHGPPRLRLRNILFDHGICNKGHQQPEAAEARVARGAYRACTLSPRWYLFAESVTDCVCVCRETVSLAGSGK